ncbi:MAG: hypothetical protein DPW18_07475 [Chloroflexi bacterium]|nr:hypothetical protein [Chloroflexota bacterium]MDL1941505.1 hypothetical protein [Chloroflexi bacterium CFX2]NOH02963.1 hypothetical protein [Chloroflexota bacterium]
MNTPVNTNLHKKTGAVVLASSYTALAVVRSLGRRGIPVWILDDRRSPTRYSRYVRRTFDLPSDGTEQAGLLLSIAKEHGLEGWSLFPDGDKGASMIARHYEQLGAYYRLTTPSWDILQWAVDKKLTYQLADEVGAAYPRVFYPKNRQDIDRIDGKFPMIVKPIHHQGQDAFSNGRAWQANNAGELAQIYAEMTQIADPSVILVQEMIPGGPGTQFSFAALCVDGTVRAEVFAERKRLTPARFGVSAYVESYDFIDIRTASQKWLEKIRYTGLVEIEYMLDKRDSVYKMLDVNTRPWGWIAMCAYAGVDFPYLMWKLSQGETVEEVRGRGGVGWSRTMFDLAAMFELIRLRSSVSIFEFIGTLLRAKHEMYISDDLRPAFMEFFLLAARAYRKVLKILGLYKP